MAYVSTKELLLDAQKNHYAVGAFNIENLETAQAVVNAAEKLDVPVIIQTTASSIRYAGVGPFAGIVKALAAGSRARIALHLDHGDSYELAEQCKNAGYSSVMIDGSKLPFEENIALSSSVVKMCAGLPVEAELGTVGGKEENDMAEGEAGYTKPEDAAEFVERTHVDFLAVAIGTAHGIYKGIPKLDIPRLAKIRSMVDIPLVLHGASGVPDEQVAACIDNGITKVNYATELRIAFTKGVKEAIAENPDAFDPKVYLKAARVRAQEFVENRIHLVTRV
ncbi:MAG: class II fructose-bisphosphate aldolase [Clostridia bacterium]|nr:class II fructose-bisphosphate aldolase [Clostridia bacterium]